METLDGIKADALAAESPAVPAGAAAPDQAAPAALDAAEAAAWAEIPKAFGDILCMALPELRPAYSPENCLRWGEQMVEVAKRYGWSSKIIGPWVGLAIATVPMAVPTIAAVRAARAARAPAAPAGDTVEGEVTARKVDAQPGAPQRVKPIG